MLCLTLIGPTMKKNAETYKRKKDFADIVELRLDCIDYNDINEVSLAKRFPSSIDKPVILTCRRKVDGGLYDADERSRFKLIKSVADGDFSFVDLEWNVHRRLFEKSLKRRKIEIIRSYHNFKETSEDLSKIFKKLCVDGSIAKLCVQINTTDDLVSLINFSKKIADNHKHIIVGMGNTGICTRILYKKTGSFLTYCCEKEIAPGMICIDDMKNLYHADKISDKTKIFGVVGNPVLHSKSPLIHNSGFSAVGYDGVYVPFEVDNYDRFMELAKILNVKGFSVTSPFKTQAFKNLDLISDECKKTGACNTVIHKNYRWKGYNTDYSACEKLFPDNKKNVLILGAGGAARALVLYFVNRKNNVTVINRTEEKAQELSKTFGCRYDSMKNLASYSGKADLIIRAVKTGYDTAKSFEFSGNETVCDLYYKPEMTTFLKRAEKSGCKIITGLDFLRAQGTAQFEFFTNTPFPCRI